MQPTKTNPLLAEKDLEKDAPFFGEKTLNKSKDALTKKCPFCAEEIKIEAVKCRHCGSDLIINNGKAKEDKIKTLSCQQCSGEMVKRKEFGHIGSSCILFIIGFIILIFNPVIGGLIILVSLVFGIIRGFSYKKYWICKKCSYKIERW